ncbi:ATP-dependent helicase [Cardinium endosymbiont of Oedothorax gibbosus]|uniref:ATP-dependent helicase n=1 Tax=Cardinium endosymbiont of Oedothorax gibbosus TaxID=931101 RepID=UPI002023FA5E|nr:UvrD-helicase domain-containing protein [Cardinium endosymbiont of Oedothorax gibbosus]CAH2559971.1 ATP-dependent DNA helicase PcrA [Cardinium endosymbiont of Oedothorax gibbosus]
MESIYLSGLNEMQKKAVMHTEGPSIVVAGAGSGKTKVLIARIAHLLKEKKAAPDQILALTFTNKAADEMRHRITGIVGNGAKALWLGTFHSVFMKLLRREANTLGYPSHFSIYDTDDSKSLIKQITKALDLDDKIYKPGVILGRISHAKNRLITPEVYAADPTYQKEDAYMRMPRFSEIFLRYAGHCLQAGAMDFDDLLVQTHKLLYDYPALSAKYQQQFHYLLIDEFQDTNLVQYSIAKKLAAHHQNICVVGDDAQSIYAFRGADIHNILHFVHDYPNHQMIKLEQNYRSTRHIVNTANHIISHNEAQLKKKVWTANPLGAPIQVLRTMSDMEESRLVVDQILVEKLSNQLLYRDFAILYRTNKQSRNFEEALRKKNIPYHIIGGLSFYQRKEVKDLLAYLRFVVNHNDTEAFRRIINFPRRGIGPTTIDKIVSISAESVLPLWTVLGHLNDFLSSTAATAVSRFVALIDTATLKLESENAYTIADYMAKASGLLKELHEDKTVEGLIRYEHIQELLNSIKHFVDYSDNNDPSLGSFLQEIALLTSADKENVHEDAVTLMTIHASKGLEFKYVYLVGMEEELFPSSMMLGSKADLEEERRLFYVAVTRAQLKLTLSHALSRYRFGKLTNVQPSRFLKEIGDHTEAKTITKSSLLATTAKPIQKHPTKLSSSARKIGVSSVAQPTTNLASLQVGHSVHHLYFGVGQVLKLVESAGMRKAVILFHKFGEKTLLLNYAKLDILPST